MPPLFRVHKRTRFIDKVDNLQGTNPAYCSHLQGNNIAKVHTPLTVVMTLRPTFQQFFTKALTFGKLAVITNFPET